MSEEECESAGLRPGVDGVEEGEELQYDPTAYDCMHVMSLDWPCLRCAAYHSILSDMH